ncbi:hypothetical protein C8F01DRAFT_1119258, partial [Mycena amicta]
MAQPATSDPSTPGAIGMKAIDFGQLLSSQLIGSLVDFFLTGALVVQIVIYHISFPKDSRAFKAIVYGLLVLVLSRLCLVAYEVQYLFAAGFGDIERLASQSTHQYSPFMAPIIISIVQHFFAYRIFSLERRCWPVCVLISVLSLGQCAVGLAAIIVLQLSSKPLDTRLELIDDLSRAWYISGIATALVNTFTTAFVLSRVRSVDPTTKQAVRNVVRFTIESNVASAVVEIVSLALLEAYPDSTFYIGTSFLLPSVYSNMLLTTLNYRAIVRHQQASPESTEVVFQEASSRRSTLLQPPSNSDPGVKTHDQRRVSFVDSVTLGSVGSVPAGGPSVRPSEEKENVQHQHNYLPHAEHFRRGDVEVRVDEERSVVL